MCLQGDSRVGGPSSMRIVAGAVGRGEDAARARVALGVSVGRARARRGAGEEEGLVLLVGEHVQRQLLQIDLEVGVVVVRKRWYSVAFTPLTKETAARANRRA